MSIMVVIVYSVMFGFGGLFGGGLGLVGGFKWLLSLDEFWV